jgi:adenine phosphoribosyltransferase
MSALEHLIAAVRDVTDFPKPGIVFKDITPILGNGALFQEAIDALAAQIEGQQIDKVVGIDARGFIFGAALAYKLARGFVPVRKKGKLPWKTHGVAYDLEYGSATVEIHQDAIVQGERVVLVDDLLATGGTAAAALKLIRDSGAIIVAAQFVLELEFLNGRSKLEGVPIHSLLKA